MKVIKRNHTEVDFDKEKIYIAIKKAVRDARERNILSLPTDEQIGLMVDKIENKIKKTFSSILVEDIQDFVEKELFYENYYDLMKVYMLYRYSHSNLRKDNNFDNKIISLIELKNEELNQENSNKNSTIIPTQRDYIAGEVNKRLTNKYFLPKDVIEADKHGLIHFHDKDYFAQRMYNCCLVNLEDMLQNGTVISGTKIDKPHSFSTACTIATQIVAQVASNQYGGQSISLAHLAPFVDVSRKKIEEEVSQEMSQMYNIFSQGADSEDIDEIEKLEQSIIDKRLKKEIEKGIQTIQYQVETLMTTNGQSPFITVFMYLNEAKNEREKEDLAMIIEETIKQRYQGIKNEKGVWITPAFPKIIYVLEDDNITENSKYWYLTKLAATCTAKRLVPDYISEKIMKKLKKGDCFPVMGCRSALTPFDDENGNRKYYGRFNKGVVTINLVDVALSSNRDIEKFWNIFDKRLELCHKALLCRYERLKGTISNVAPILWQYGAIARLKKGETIDKFLTGGYSSISLGYAGLYECVKYMTGRSHTDPKATDFALCIMQHMNDCCTKWNEQLNLGFGIYGTPLETTTYTFAKTLKKRFGIIEGITDKNYITNSYHIPVTEKTDAFSKLAFESKFQALSTGGAISYVEVSNLQNNITAVLETLKFIYDNIMYAEINTKSDYCQKCGFDGEIQIVEDDSGKLIWKCPNCGNTNQDTMNITRRTCGLT